MMIKSYRVLETTRFKYGIRIEIQWKAEMTASLMCHMEPKKKQKNKKAKLYLRVNKFDLI